MGAYLAVKFMAIFGEKSQLTFCDIAMKKIKLLGELGKKFGRIHMLDVNSTAEAIRALCANFKDFEKWMANSEERGVRYKIFVRNVQINLDEIYNPASKEITIAPILIGSKKGLFKAVLGIALIVASFYLPGMMYFSAYSSIGIDLAAISFSMGVSMALGGVAQMLAPMPSANSGNESNLNNQPSYSFNGAINTTAQGHPVPIGYGRLIIGSAVISGGLKAQNI
jgi:predicted phage tail protein